MSKEELSPIERREQQHKEVYSSLKDHYLALRRLLLTGVESIDHSIAILDMQNPPGVPELQKDDDT